MPIATIYVNDTVSVGAPFAPELPATAVTGHPYMFHPSPLAIFNGQGSNAVLRIKLMDLHPLTGPNGATSSLVVQRITALVGGVGNVPIKYDTASANLPAQVLLREFPSSVTTVANSTYRRTMTLVQQNLVRALAPMCAAIHGDSRTGLDKSQLAKLNGDAALTGYVLREGQGISISYAANSPYHGYRVAVTFSVAGVAYFCEYIVNPMFMSGDTVFAILNGVGSGIVLEIENVQVEEIGTDEVVVADYQPIDGIMGAECMGQDASYTKADSSVSIPSQVLIKKNCVTARAGYKAGALMTLPTQRKTLLAEPPYGPAIAGLQMGRQGVYAADMSGPDILLREGQGVGLFLRNGGALLYHEATAIVQVETVAAPIGGGAKSFAY